MKLRKLLSLVLAAVMFFGCMTITAFAVTAQTLTAGTVAELTTAFENANDGDSIKLTATIDGSSEDPEECGYCFTVSGKTITLDLGEYNIIGGGWNATAGKAVAVLTLDNATVTLIGTTGAIKNYYGDYVVEVKNSSVLNINSGTVKDDNSCYTILLNNGTVNVNGGTVGGNYIVTIPDTTSGKYGAYNICNGNIAAFNGTELIDSTMLDCLNISISGGKFNIAPAASLLADGYEVKDLGEQAGTYRYQVVNTTSCYLDLETSKTYADKKEIEQNYTFTQESEEYTDVTKVKLEWTITDIAATYTSNKTWDPDTLTWKETKTVADIADKTVEFTLTNYSSKKVVGTVSFEADETVSATLASATFDDNNGKTIDTVVNSDYTIDETKKTNVPSNKITATLKFNADKFADLATTTSATKYGTYTVTLATKKDATVTAPTTKTTSLTYSNSEQELVTAGITNGGTWQYKLNDGEYSTTVPKAKNAGTYTVYYKLVGDETYNDIAEASVQVTIAKATQTAPSAPSKDNATVTSTTVTLEAVSAGQGDTYYGYSTENDASNVTNWQKGVEFNGLDAETTYYFFAKYEGDTNYNEAVSAGTPITTLKVKIAQTSPNAPETETEGDYAVELKSVSAGYGTTYYGWSKTNNASTVTNWQTSVEFTGLEEETTYYFFAKYAGNDTYNEAVSQGTEVITGGCFVAGTKITMADGSIKNIEEIVIGDEVISYDVVKGEFYTTTINKVWTSANTTISTITLTDGTQIQCTPNHPICTTEGFKSVNPNFTDGLKEYPSTKLNIGNMVVTDHGTFAVSSIETNDGESVAVYNLSVVSNGNELNNTFVANGVVAHNKLT